MLQRMTKPIIQARNGAMSQHISLMSPQYSLDEPGQAPAGRADNHNGDDPGCNDMIHQSGVPQVQSYVVVGTDPRTGRYSAAFRTVGFIIQASMARSA